MSMVFRINCIHLARKRAFAKANVNVVAHMHRACIMHNAAFSIKDNGISPT